MALRKYILAIGALAVVCVTVPVVLTRGSKSELVQKQQKSVAASHGKFADHSARHYIPINVGPLGTDSLFIGKGDGEGVSMKAHKQQLTLVHGKDMRARSAKRAGLSVEIPEVAMESHMDTKACKQWGAKMARRRALHLEDKVGSPKDRRIAQHCGALFAAKMHQTKVDIAIKMKHMKARKAAAAAKAAAEAAAAKGEAPGSAQAAPVDAAPKAAAAAPLPAAAAAATQQKAAVMQAKKAAADPWWKRKHFGFKKAEHMKRPIKGALPVFDPKAASKAKDMAYYKKVGLV